MFDQLLCAISSARQACTVVQSDQLLRLHQWQAKQAITHKQSVGGSAKSNTLVEDSPTVSGTESGTALTGDRPAEEMKCKCGGTSASRGLRVASANQNG